MSDTTNSESALNRISAKLEDSFLKILRIVILIVALVSLVGSIIFGLVALSNSTASPNDYDYESPNINELAQEAKDSVASIEEEKKPKAATPKEPAKNEEKEVKEKDDLDKEWDKQVKLLADWLIIFDRSMNNPETVRNTIINQTVKLSLPAGDKETGEENYARGYTKYLEKVTSDKETNDILLKVNDQQFGKYWDTILYSYAQYHSAQQKEAEKFMVKEIDRAVEDNAGATMQFYKAAGLFGLFLVINLILVLVKIERNLRGRPL